MNEERTDDYREVVDLQFNLFDEREVHTNCTVEIWRNSVTGETSIGWWDNNKPPTETDWECQP